MLTGKQKLYFLLINIKNQKEITPSNRPVKLHPANDLNNRLSKYDLDYLFEKLEVDEKVIKVRKTEEKYKPRFYQMDSGCYLIDVLKRFDEYFSQIELEPEYQKFTGKRPSTPKSQSKIQFEPNRKAVEKIWNVLQEIEEKRQLGSDDKSIRLTRYLSNVKDADKLYGERNRILEKLQSLKAITKPHKAKVGAFNYWSLRPSENYQKVFKKYQKATRAYQQSKQMEEVKIKDPVYKVKYSEQTREILINNFILKKLRSFSDNDAIFAYLYKNPNQDKSDNDIKDGTGLKTIKDLNKFLDNIGFKGELRKVFFKVAKNKIRFNNPISKKHLKEVGIEYLKLK